MTWLPMLCGDLRARGVIGCRARNQYSAIIPCRGGASINLLHFLPQIAAENRQIGVPKSPPTIPDRFFALIKRPRAWYSAMPNRTGGCHSLWQPPSSSIAISSSPGQTRLVVVAVVADPRRSTTSYGPTSAPPMAAKHRQQRAAVGAGSLLRAFARHSQFGA